MILTIFGVFAFFFLFALATVETICICRELIARRKKHKAEAQFYDAMTEYIQEKNIFIVDEVSI